MMFGVKQAKRQMGSNTLDRISELPEFILHKILSILDTKEAGRASVLSKIWYAAWSSIPVLDFQPQYVKNYSHYLCRYHDDFYDDYTVERYLRFIDKTMERYFTRKCRITKLYLELPKVDDRIEPLVDKWIRIAVENQIQELYIEVLLEDSPYYRLPAILFRSKSLKALKCKRNLKLIYHETMELLSLECLKLRLLTIDDDMLQRIISSCPLIELNIRIDAVKKLYIPWMRNVNEETLQSNVKVSPLRKFVFRDTSYGVPFPLNIKTGPLKNLRKLEIESLTMADDFVSKLAYELVALETLILTSCSWLKCINISSKSLKEFKVTEGYDTKGFTIDAPNLLNFWCNCEVDASLSLIRAQDHFNIQFSPMVISITTVWFTKLNKFLVETNCFKSVMMDLSDPVQIVVDEDQERNVVSCSPYKLREFKLCVTRAWNLSHSLLTEFLDGLFLTCHPDVLSVTAGFLNHAAESILTILKYKVQCWKHPLKSIEVEGVEGSSLLSGPLTEPSELEIRFRLSWFSG